MKNRANHSPAPNQLRYSYLTTHMKRPLLAAVAAFAAMFSLAGLFTMVLARDFIATHVDPALLRNPPNLPLIALGYAALAALMAYLYPKLVRVTGSPPLRGLRFGLMVAVCWLMPYSLALFGAYRFPYSALPLDFGWALIEQGTGGALIGLIYGRTRTPL